MIANKNELILKLQKRKDTLDKIIREKTASLDSYEYQVKGTSTPQRSVLEKYENKKTRLAEYQEHYDLLCDDLVGIENKTDEEVLFIWDFFDTFIQSSAYVKKILAMKKGVESSATPKPKKPRKKAATI